MFFLITYLLFAAVFSAVGAAVNEMREAQSLMTPVMLLLMAPWMFATVIGREPNSTFSVALSFIPPVNTFAMMIRLGIGHAASDVAGAADHARGPGGGVRRHLVRGEDLQGGSAHARQAAEHVAH